jgi:hypothetical protein
MAYNLNDDDDDDGNDDDERTNGRTEKIVK